MKISEIIDGLEEVQNSSLRTDSDVTRVCELSVRLALHVQQLEVDMRKLEIQVIWGSQFNP